jgi:Domain of unknown function (DUF929)
MAKKQTNRSNVQRTSSAARGATATATRPVVKSPAASGVSSSGAVKKAPSAAAQAANERIVAARQRNEAARLAAQRRRALEGGWLRQRWPIVAAFVTVVLLIAIFFTIAHNASSGSASIGNPVPDKILTQVTTVSPSVFEKVGKGTIANPFQKVQGTPLPPVNKTADGKPIFLYVGGEYCPYCAAERWSMVIALSRFGTFKDLALTQSSSTDVYPNTSTFTFHGASYTSQYLAFQAVETADRNGASLDKPTSDQQAIFAKYDAPPYISSSNAGSIPFLSVGNQYVEISAGFIPDQMNGLTWQQIADKLNDPTNTITQSIVANANYITAALCQITDSKPANVCTAAPIPAIIADMKAGK